MKRRIPSALVTALSLFVALTAAFGGASFVRCAAMARAQLSCCCPATMRAARQAGIDAAHRRGDDVLERVCCEAHRFEAAPPSEPGPHPTLHVAPSPSSVLPIALWMATLLEPAEAARGPSPVWQRDGPSPPLFALHRHYRN